MTISPSVIHRAKQKKKQQMQSGTVLSFTTVRHPPKGFGSAARLLALIELEDSSRIIAPIETSASVPLIIGSRVTAHMRLSRTNAQGLRVYEPVYRVVASVPKSIHVHVPEFSGYMIAFTGPSGVGRTTVAGVLATALSDVTEIVPLVTYRKRHGFKYGRVISKSAYQKQERSGDIVTSQQSSIPCGYATSDIEAVWKCGKLPIIIAEQELLKELSSVFGRRSILSFGLLPPGKSKRVMLSHLLHRLRSCERYGETMIKQQLNMADAALAFVKQKAWFDEVIVNEDPQDVVSVITRYLEGMDLERQ